MELTRSDPAVAPAPKTAAFPNFSPSFLAHAPCCAGYEVSIILSYRNTTYLGMLRVGRMVRVLRRLRQLRHVDIAGPLRVARVDVLARDAAGLLLVCIVSWFSISVAFFFGMGRGIGGIGDETYGELAHDGLELGWVEEPGVTEEFELGADGAEGAVGGGGFDAHFSF